MVVEDELQCGGIAINREVNTQSTEVENGQTLGWVEGGGRSHHSTVEDVTSTVWGAQCALAIQHFFRLLWTDVTWRSPHLTVKDTISNRLSLYLDK